jgi:predicted MFS family arabinose efflux permease
MIRPIANAYRAAYSGLPRDVWLLALTLLVNRAGGMVLPFLSLYLTEARGLSVATAGRVLAAYGLGAIAGAWLGGWASDRVGATRTQQASLLASGAGYIGVGALSSPVAIACGLFCLSVVVEAYRPAAMADGAARAPAGLQARAFALMRLAVNIGVGIGPAVGGFLALHSYRWLFVADGATCWLAWIVLVLTLAPVAGARERGVGPSGVARPPWRDLPFLGLWSFCVVLATVFFQLWSTLPLYYREHYGFREDTIGLLLALNPLLIVLFEMVLVRRIERLSRMPVIGLGAFLVGAGLGLMPLGATLGFVALTIVVWTAGEMLALPMVNATVADRAAPGMLGRYMGLYVMAFAVAFVLAPACGTLVWQRFGPSALWYGTGVVGAALGLAALALRRPLERRGP